MGIPVGYTQSRGYWFKQANGSGPYSLADNGSLILTGGGTAVAGEFTQVNGLWYKAENNSGPYAKGDDGEFYLIGGGNAGGTLAESQIAFGSPAGDVTGEDGFLYSGGSVVLNTANPGLDLTLTASGAARLVVRVLGEDTVEVGTPGNKEWSLIHNSNEIARITAAAFKLSQNLQLAAGKTVSLDSAITAPMVGNTVLVAGTVDVATSVASATSFVILQRKVAGGVLGNLTYSVDPGVGITISSTNIADTSTVSWVILESYSSI